MEPAPAMAELDPKVALLRQKLALVMGEGDCAVYNTIKAQHPNALEEPWSTTMEEPLKYVVFNNKTFTMHQVHSHHRAYEHTLQADPIDCGESIKLYLNDNLFRDLMQAETMNFEQLQRSEQIARRAVKSKWYFWLTGWANKINGGPGTMSPSGILRVAKWQTDGQGGSGGPM